MKTTHYASTIYFVSVITALAMSCATNSGSDDTEETSAGVLGDPDAPCSTISTEADPSIEARWEQEQSGLPIVPDSEQEQAQLDGKIEVGIAFHVIAPYRGSSADLGPVQISNRTDILNKAYSTSSFHFHVALVTRTYSRLWFFHGYDNLTIKNHMEQRLHRGGPRTLNVYSTNTHGGGVSSYPWNHERFGTPWWGDGIWIPTTLGNVNVHESGHWLGLYHTFEGDSCTGPGDHVADTQVSLKTSGCSVVDTCPASPGNDPIHNYMAYNCGTHFTVDQRRRMVFWWNYRTRQHMKTGGDDLAWTDVAPGLGEEPWPETEVEVIP